MSPVKSAIATFQIGKAGITKGVITSLNLVFKSHYQIRIGVLPASERNRASIKTMAQELVKRMGIPCNYKIIGFTIILIKRGKTQPLK